MIILMVKLTAFAYARHLIKQFKSIIGESACIVLGFISNSFHLLY